MNNEFFHQAEQLFKPVTEIMALNARTFEALAEKQTGLMSGMWSEGLNCAKDMSGKQDMQSVYAAQREFWESMSQKMNTTARDSYNLLTEAQEEMGKLVQNSFSSADFSSMGMSSAAAPFQQAQETAERTAQQAAEATQSTADATKATTQKSAEAAETTAKSTAKAASKASNKVTEKASDKAPEKATGAAKGQGGKSSNKANG